MVPTTPGAFASSRPASPPSTSGRVIRQGSRATGGSPPCARPQVSSPPNGPNSRLAGLHGSPSAHWARTGRAVATGSSPAGASPDWRAILAHPRPRDWGKGQATLHHFGPAKSGNRSLGPVPRNVEQVAGRRDGLTVRTTLFQIGYGDRPDPSWFAHCLSFLPDTAVDLSAVVRAGHRPQLAAVAQSVGPPVLSRNRRRSVIGSRQMGPENCETDHRYRRETHKDILRCWSS
jgi:hypothetical protein